MQRPEGVSESSLPPRLGRYQVAGQIARGGVGSVHKARDVDLGRDVAIKVLLEEHGSHADMIRRFIEEAQIGGQLQHPSIVPVHELGLVSEQRPYFSRKLVKGKTLARLLADRDQPGANRQRFLAIFEQICQPLAYAHARAVIHRDLKPSNVMVGPFGEVQVMDWGLAKVLESGEVADVRRGPRQSRDLSVIQTLRTGTSGTDSIAGSVLGTPAYMPPEQARGDIEALDERSDVFGLGAILCEVLTGKPPYTGATADAVFRAARNGYLEDALERIERSGADREVIELAKRCLAFEPRDRPRDGGVVAKAMRGYLDSLADRARALEIQAAEARVRAKGERKARRLTAALALVVVSAVVAGAIAWMVEDGERRDRRERLVTTVHTALAKARAYRDRAREGPREAPEWDLAFALLEKSRGTRTRASTPSRSSGCGERSGCRRFAHQTQAQPAFFL